MDSEPKLVKPSTLDVKDSFEIEKLTLGTEDESTSPEETPRTPVVEETAPSEEAPPKVIQPFFFQNVLLDSFEFLTERAVSTTQ